MNRRLCWLLTFLLLALCLAVPACVQAAPGKDVRLVDPDTGATIRWFYEAPKSTYVFFLPSGILPEKWQISLPDGLAATLDGKPVKDGDLAVGFAIGQTHEIIDDHGSYVFTLMQSENIASVFVTTQSGNEEYLHAKKGNEEAGTLVYYLPTGDYALMDDLEHVKTRGNASFNFEKKSYQVKLMQKASVGGMEAAKRWLLIGNPRDRALLRNKITMDMAIAAGLTTTPESEFVDLYLNGDYRGNYLLCEKVEINDGRVDIEDLEKATEEVNGGKLDGFKRLGDGKYKIGAKKYYDIPVNPSDITGGYLIEYEAYSSRYAEEASAFGSKRGATLVIKSPEFASEAQMGYITTLLQRFESAFSAPDGIDPASGKHFTELGDVDSLACRYLCEEISKNYDGNTSSLFFYKPEDSVSAKLFGGPAWDYDSAYGAYAREEGMAVLKSAGFFINASSQKRHWWPALYKQPEFAEAAARIYRERYAPLLDQLLGYTDPGIIWSINQYAEHIADSAAMNFLRWPLSTHSSTGVQIAPDFMGNVEILSDFIDQRKVFLDEQWDALPTAALETEIP